MAIKQKGGVFGRNPTFNDVDIEGTLTVNGEPISDFGTMAQQDANNVNIDGGNIDGTTIGASATAPLSATTGAFGGDVSIDVGAGNPQLLIKTAGVGNNPYAQLQASTNVFDMMGVFSATPDYWRVGYGTSGTASTEILKVFSGGDVEVENGNLVIGTSGKGIDFSATAGTGTSELFDDYEEGVWTPADGSGAGLTFTSPIGRYTKIGNIVWASGFVTYPTTSDGSGITITGLPFNVANNNASSIGALTYKQTADAAIIKAEPNTDDVRVFNSTGSSTTNAQQSAKVLYFGVVYQA